MLTEPPGGGDHGVHEGPGWCGVPQCPAEQPGATVIDGAQRLVIGFDWPSAEPVEIPSGSLGHSRYLRSQWHSWAPPCTSLCTPEVMIPHSSNINTASRRGSGTHNCCALLACTFSDSLRSRACLIARQHPHHPLPGHLPFHPYPHPTDTFSCYARSRILQSFLRNPSHLLPAHVPISAATSATPSSTSARSPTS